VSVSERGCCFFDLDCDLAERSDFERADLLAGESAGT
jgi:hypothetical protein